MSYSVVFARHNRNRFVVATRADEGAAQVAAEKFSAVVQSLYLEDMKGGTFKTLPTSLVRNLKVFRNMETHLDAEAMLHD